MHAYNCMLIVSTGDVDEITFSLIVKWNCVETMCVGKGGLYNGFLLLTKFMICLLLINY